MASLLFWMVIVSLSNGLAGQSLITQMEHQTWTARDGVPPNIETIVQATNGLLWISTDAGLYVFDGVSFRRYSPVSGDSFLSPGFNMMSGTADGSLWLSYSTGGLGRLKDGHLKNFTYTRGTKANVYKVVEDGNGTFWAATSQGLQTLDGSGEFHSVAEQYGDEVNRSTWLTVDGTGNLWLQTLSKLFLIPRGSHQALEVANARGNANGASYPGVGSDLWVAQRHGIVAHYVFENYQIKRTVITGTDKAFRLVPAERGDAPRLVADGSPLISTLVVSPDATIWVGTEKGLLRFTEWRSRAPHATAQRIEVFDKHEGLSGNFVFDSLRDREGSIWFATTNGLDRFREVPFHAIDLGQRAPVTLLHGKPSKDTFVATDCLINVSKDSQRCLFPRENTWARSLYRAHDGSLWIGLINQLRHIKGHSSGLQKLPYLNNVFNPVMAVAQDSKDRLWISIGEGNGLFRLDRGKWIRDGGLNGFPNSAPLAINQDSSGDLWFAFRDDLVSHLHDDHLQTFDSRQGLNLGAVKVFAFLGPQLVVGGEKGVAFLRSGNFTNLVFAGASVPTEVTGLAFAPDKSLWVNSSTGIFRIDERELAHALSEPHHAVASERFDSQDGVVGLPHLVMGLGSIVLASDMRLYIANRENLQWIDPLDLPRNKVIPEVLITDWQADGINQSWPTGAVHTNSNLKRLQIGYTASSLLIPKRVQFRYRLEGFEETWVEAGARRTAFYSNVPPGKYTFQVLACNDAGVWSKSGANLTFIVPPTFSQTLVFRSLCALISVILFTLIYRLRVGVLTKRVQERLYERLSERERIARDLHDTFFQSIQGLLLRFNTATATLPPASQSRQMLEETLQRSDEVMREGRELLLDLRNNVIEPDNLPAVLADFGRQLQANYDCEFEVLVNGSALPLNAAVSKELVAIGKEAVFNAFTHAKAQKIEVDLSYERHFLKMSVRDNGKGVDALVLESGRRDGHYGLPGMKERAAGIGAVFNLWSRQGAGTEVEVRLAAKVALTDSRSRRS